MKKLPIILALLSLVPGLSANASDTCHELSYSSGGGSWANRDCTTYCYIGGHYDSEGSCYCRNFYQSWTVTCLDPPNQPNCPTACNYGATIYNIEYWDCPCIVPCVGGTQIHSYEQSTGSGS